MSSSPTSVASDEVTSIKETPLDRFMGNLVGYMQLYLSDEHGLHYEFMREMYNSVKRSNLDIKLEALTKSLDIIKGVRNEDNMHKINQDIQSVLGGSVAKFHSFSESPDYFLRIFNDFSHAITTYSRKIVKQHLAGRPSLDVINEERGGAATLSATDRVAPATDSSYTPAVNRTGHNPITDRANPAATDRLDRPMAPPYSQQSLTPPQARYDQKKTAGATKANRDLKAKSTNAAAGTGIFKLGSSYLDDKEAGYKTRYPLPNLKEAEIDTPQSVRKVTKAPKKSAKTLEQEALKIYSDSRLTGWTKYDKTYHHQAGSGFKKRSTAAMSEKSGITTKDQQEYLRLYGRRNLPAWYPKYGETSQKSSSSLGTTTFGQSSKSGFARYPSRAVQPMASTIRMSKTDRVISHTFTTGGGR